jgi:hypothetical protein
MFRRRQRPQGRARASAHARLSLLCCVLAPLVAAAQPGCPPEGDATDGGTRTLNRLKNRTQPPDAYAAVTVPELLALPGAATDARGIVLEGFIVAAKQSGPESANCHSQRDVDFHVSIAADAVTDGRAAQAARAQSVIVEPTPWTQHALGLHLRVLQRLARDGARVRIYGWQMFDPQHPDQLGRTRGTLWEVHPVTRIDVWSGGAWRPLDGAAP